MTSILSCIEVAVALPVFRTYSYSVSNGMKPDVEPGKRVLVPFGRRRVTGYIIGNHGEPPRGCELRQILDILDPEPLFPAAMIPFYKWISDYYMYPLGEVIRDALPGGMNVYDLSAVAITGKGRQSLREDEVGNLERAVLSCLADDECLIRDLGRKLDRKVSLSAIHMLEKRGLITGKRKLVQGRTRPKMERHVVLRQPPVDRNSLSDARRRIVDSLEERGELSVSRLKAIVPTAPRLIRSMADAGYVSVEQRAVYRDPFGAAIEPDTPPVLTAEQQVVVAAVTDQLKRGFATFLLAGVTGSGKTEVYLRLAAAAVQRGRDVLILVPEIALISQMERRARARFGETIAVLHSGLSAGERYDQWMRIRRGEAPIVIGARSAIFAPLGKPGLIVVDEEHDSSYKQDGKLRYNARDLAVVRAKQSGGVALLGSATPSVQSVHNARSGKFTPVFLTHRVQNRPLPTIRVVDLRETKHVRGIGRFITPPLRQAMTETLERGEQVLLFLNRRGFASYPVCRSCGQAIRCKHCDISLTLHQSTRAYRCHYCGYSISAASPCPDCGAADILNLGLGTEKLESWVTALFPEARVARMDRDTTRRKGAIVKILKDLQNRSIDILVGTQMVAKGHDFPGITLVGIVCADLSLSFPDFRASEHTFQLLAQVAGRAGRGQVPGQVILQTYNPDHFSILAAKDQDFEAFFKPEIGFRKALAYPPYTRIVQLKISGKEKDRTARFARTLGERCKVLMAGDPAFSRSLVAMGPIEAPIPRIAGRYRWQLLLKGSTVTVLKRFVSRLLYENGEALRSSDVSVAVDVDPIFLA